MVVSAIKTCHHTVVSSVQFSNKKRIITSQGICEAQNIIVINIIAITTPQLRRSTFFTSRAAAESYVSVGGGGGGGGGGDDVLLFCACKAF